MFVEDIDERGWLKFAEVSDYYNSQPPYMVVRKRRK